MRIIVKSLFVTVLLAAPLATWAFFKRVRVLAPTLAGLTCPSADICIDELARLQEAFHSQRRSGLVCRSEVRSNAEDTSGCLLLYSGVRQDVWLYEQRRIQRRNRRHGRGPTRLEALLRSPRVDTPRSDGTHWYLARLALHANVVPRGYGLLHEPRSSPPATRTA